MPYRVVEYTTGRPRHHGRRIVPGRPPHATVHYTGRTNFGKLIPRVAHGRLASVPPPPRFMRGQDIYALGEEAYRLPYRTKVVYIEDATNYGNYDNSCHELQLYNGETEEIRRDIGNTLLCLAYGAPPPLYSYRNFPLRSSSELRDVVDVRRKFVRDRNHLSSMSRIQSEIYRMAKYAEPARKKFAGKGNLACLSFAGGRPIAKRQLRFFPEDNGIRDIINFRSFYNNLRVAATLGSFYKRPVTYQPLYKSKKSLMGIKDDKEEKPRKEVESKWVTRKDSFPKAEKAVPKPEFQQSYVLPAPRKSIIEFEEDVQNISMHEPEPEVVMKIPRKSIQEDSGVVPEAKETVVLPPNRLEEKKSKELEPSPIPDPLSEQVFKDAEQFSPTPEDEKFETAEEIMETHSEDPMPEAKHESIENESQETSPPEPEEEPKSVVEPKPQETPTDESAEEIVEQVPSKELSGEVMEESKEEIKEEVKEEINEDVTEEMKEEVKEEIKEEVNEDIKEDEQVACNENTGMNSEENFDKADPEELSSPTPLPEKIKDDGEVEEDIGSTVIEAEERDGIENNENEVIGSVGEEAVTKENEAEVEDESGNMTGEDAHTEEIGLKDNDEARTVKRDADLEPECEDSE